jgi:protein disulfide-isomerase
MRNFWMGWLGGGLLLSLAAGCGKAADAPAQPAAWLTSLEKAQQESKTSGRPILALFTGSDWCPWCVRLEKEVLATAEFQEWAGKKVVLVKFDFLRKTQQPQEVKDANQAARKKYPQVKGYPTILFLNEKGEVLGESGYEPGGAKAWMEKADKLLPAAKK